MTPAAAIARQAEDEMNVGTFEEITANILRQIPRQQLDRVFQQEMCDIDYEFMGFVDIYKHLSLIIPKHFTVVDLGCAYAPQAFLFVGHAAYIGVDTSAIERFSAENTQHYTMTISEFLKQHGLRFNQNTTFAICSYVPPWHNDNMKLARHFFKNVFTFYPCSQPLNLEKKLGVNK